MYFGVRGEFQNKDSISFERKRVHEAATTSFTSLPHINRKLTGKEFTISVQIRDAWLTSSLPELSAVGRDWRVRLAFNLNSTPPPSSLLVAWRLGFGRFQHDSRNFSIYYSFPSSKSRLLKIRNSWRGTRSWSNRSGFAHKSLLEQITSGANCNVHWQLKRRKNKQTELVMSQKKIKNPQIANNYFQF